VVAEIAGYLADSISVNLVGMKGSGRSTVAQLVADRLQAQGFTVVSIFGVAALRDRPLAALAASRVDVPISPSGPTISGAVAALAKRLADQSALVVDDADELDSASAGAIVAAHVHQQFPIFAVTRPAGQAAATALLGDVGQSVRLPLPPLQFDELHRAVHALLPGAVDPSAVAQIATLCGGLPRLMNAIVDTGRRTGALAEADGLWRARRSLWDERLSQVVEPLLSDLDADDLSVLSGLAATGAVPLSEAKDLSGDAFDRLCQLELLHVVDTPAGPQAMVFPPLLIEYLRRPGGARQAAAEQTAEVAPLTYSRAAIVNLRIAENWQAADAALPDDVAEGLARVLQGDFTTGVDRAQRAMAAAEHRLNPGELQAYAFVAALGLSFSGRFAELQALLGPALSLDNTTVRHGTYRAGLLAVSAHVAKWFGQGEFSETLAAQADVGGPDADPFANLFRVAEAGGTDGGEPGDALWQAVEQRLADDQVAAAVLMAVEAVEAQPDPVRAAIVAERACGTQSPFLKALGDYILAAGQRDAAALKRSVAELWRLGARPHTVGAAVTLALVLREDGDMRGFIDASEDAWARAGELGRPCPGLFHRLGRAVDLSAREREVGLALARNETPAEIAADLNLSLRTIENYLSSAYRKLGSDGRADLARAVSTWAAQPGGRPSD